MIKTFKVLSALLAYPDTDLQQAAGELRDALLAERLLPAKHNTALLDFIHKMEGEDVYELQESYVALFDRTRSLSLHLFEHVHGDSRDRGQAMIDLMALYESHGMRVTARELPDYLPLFLEFLATLPMSTAKDILTQPLPVIVVLKHRLKKNNSDYAAVFAALEVIADDKSVAKAVREMFTGDASNAPQDLDREWEEQAVMFGPENSHAAPGQVYVKPPARNGRSRPN